MSADPLRGMDPTIRQALDLPPHNDDGPSVESATYALQELVRAIEVVVDEQIRLNSRQWRVLSRAMRVAHRALDWLPGDRWKLDE